MNRVELILGDWSNDGHGRSERVVLDTNLTAKEIQTAYDKGTKIVGFNLIQDCAADYEDPYIHEAEIKKLIEAGVFKAEEWKEALDTGDRYDDCEYVYLQAYYGIVKLGNPKFEYTEVKADYKNHLRIGGYGLYSH